MSHDHGHRHDGHRHDGHRHDIPADADRRWLALTLALIGTFMAGEIAVGVLAGSLALLSDAAHLLTDAGAIALALVTMRLAARAPSGGFTYGLKRAEIFSALANGVTLLLLAAWLCFEAVPRLISPPRVAGVPVLVTALVGIAVNLLATVLLGRASRTSLNVRGAYLHIVTDLFSFIATAVSGIVVMTTGYARADGIAALVVAALMVHAGIGLVRDASRVFLEAAPAGLDPAGLGVRIAAVPGVVEVHDLHVWEITSGEPAVSAHILVDQGGDCHATCVRVEQLLHGGYDIHHSTLQLDHATTAGAVGATAGGHCCEPHGEIYCAPSGSGGATGGPHTSGRTPTADARPDGLETVVLTVSDPSVSRRCRSLR